MPNDDIQLELNQALEDLRFGKLLRGKDGFLTSLIKQLTEAELKPKQEAHLETECAPNLNNLLKLLYAGILDTSEKWDCLTNGEVDSFD